MNKTNIFRLDICKIVLIKNLKIDNMFTLFSPYFGPISVVWMLHRSQLVYFFMK